MDKNSKEFKELQDKWYAKLEKKGFVDIEQEDGRLKFWSSHFFKARYSDVTFEARQEYYRMAGQFLHVYEFDSKLNRAMWELHAEGGSVRDITLALKKRGFKIYKRKVHETLVKLTKIMKATCL